MHILEIYGDDLASLTRPSLRPVSQAASRRHLGSKELGARILTFMIPVMIAVELPGLGTIYLAELCLIGLLPVLVIMRGRMLRSKLLTFILALGVLYFGSQVATDLIRETDFRDYARGWSRILFLLFSFVSTYLLIGNDRGRLLSYACGLVAGALLYLIINYPISTIGWKFGFAGPTTTIALVSFALVPVLRSPSSLIGPAIMIALGAFSAFMSYRSWGGILMLSAIFLAIPAILRLAGLRPKPLSYGHMLVTAMILLATGFGALKIYGMAAENGMLGEKSRQKYEAQSALGDLGVLLGGRSESLVTVQAIQDSPLIGHGSWAKDRYYAELRQLMLYRLGFVNRFIEPETDLIPTHSHLLGSWVEAGILGALFWAGILGLIIGALRCLYASDDPLRPYLVFLMFLFIWDILFSPFGAQRRLTNGFMLVTVLFTLNVCSMNWRQRPSRIESASTATVVGSAEVIPGMRLGLAESAPVAWQAQAYGKAAAAPETPVDENDDIEQSNRPAKMGASLADKRNEAGSLDTDGESIRAGFRRLRQRSE